jgi:hypothetical protein
VLRKGDWRVETRRDEKKEVQMADSVQTGEIDISAKFTDTPENRLVLRYLRELEAHNVEGVLALFRPDAVVHSPMYGSVPARQFFTEFLSDSAKVEVVLLGILGRGETPSGGTTTGYWARFSSTFTTGARHDFELVAIMELSEEKISAFHIVMDTALIRANFEKDTGRAAST